MRELTCAHVLTAADATVASAQTIRIDGEQHCRCRSGSDRCRYRAGAGPAGAVQRARPRPDRALELDRRVRQAAGDLAALPGADAVGRSLSGRRDVVCAQRARRCRRRDGALHPHPRADRPADRSRRGGAGGARRRRPGGICRRDARPQSAGVRPVGADPRCAVARGARGNPQPFQPHAGTARRAACAGRRSRGRRRQRDVRRAIRPAGRAVVHDRAAGSDRRSLGADRAARPHAPAGDTLPARLGRRGLPAGDRPLSRRHRLAQPAPDARALHLGAAGRTGTDRRTRRDHLGQYQLEPHVCGRASRRWPR